MGSCNLSSEFHFFHVKNASEFHFFWNTWNMKVGHLPLDKDQKKINLAAGRSLYALIWFMFTVRYTISYSSDPSVNENYIKSRHTPKTQFGQSPVGQKWKGCLFSRVLVIGCLGCVPVRCVGSQPENLTPKRSGEDPKTPIESSRDFPRKFMETPTMAPWHGNSPPPWRLSLLLVWTTSWMKPKNLHLPLGEPPKNKSPPWQGVGNCGVFFSCSCWPLGYHKTLKDAWALDCRTWSTFFR